MLEKSWKHQRALNVRLVPNFQLLKIEFVLFALKEPGVNLRKPEEGIKRKVPLKGFATTIGRFLFYGDRSSRAISAP